MTNPVNLTDLLQAIGHSNLNFQQLDNCLESVKASQGVTMVTFGTEAITPASAASDDMLHGIIIWVDRDLYQQRFEALQRGECQTYGQQQAQCTALLEALQARAEAHTGAVRGILEARLSALREAYAARLAEATTTAPAAAATPNATPLAGLLATLAQRERAAPIQTAPMAAHGEAAAFPALPAVSEFRDLWTRVRNESQQRLSLAQGPGDGGPLNSAVLVHRSLTLMSELAPGYLQHFLMYLDNLAWLEHLQPATATASKEAARNRNNKPRRARTSTSTSKT